MPETIEIAYHKSVFGELIIGTFQNQICLCDWKNRKQRNAIDARIQKGLDATFTEESNELIEKCKQQIDKFLSGESRTFDLPLLMVGTDFQKSVWHALLTIPYGNTSSYLQLSRQLKNEKAIRAVANANGANALAIIIPCHRIIGSNGDLVGYAGGIATKKKLLTLEKAKLNQQYNLF